MCGIAAIMKLADFPCAGLSLERMRDEVVYRGPDDVGGVFLRHSGCNWVEVPRSESSWEVGLGHRRLSILDLSQAGHQPMAYQERFWTIYNGEVYNFLELRTELERLGHSFVSSSDTEVILAAYAEWGTECFARFRGMWGLVILDCARQEMILCRDRLGIKPLYLWRGPGIVAVASEIKQFLHVPGFTPRMDRSVAAEYLQTGYEDSGRTFFRDVEPIQSGTWLRIPLPTLKPSQAEQYWFPEKVQVSVTNADEAGQLFAHKMQESVGIHLRSDVPIGCALSGGLDSSSIAMVVDVLKNGRGNPLHTFTSTFPGDVTDEREYADAMVSEVYASPHYVTPEPRTFLEDLDRFLWVHDEPVGSLTMYAGYCVARLTQENGVHVTMNGQGGDEVFSAYWQTYFLHLCDLWRQARWITLARHFTGALMRSGNSTLVNQIPVMMRRYRARSKPPLSVRFRGADEPKTGGVLKEILSLDEQARRVYEIRRMFLPRMLKWDDRNFMAFSVEGRYPLLDHELIELCLSFASHTLYKDGWTKHPLRLGLKNKLPSKILYRRSKFGFETPQDKWLCGELRPVLENWLKEDRSLWDYVDRKDAQHLAEQTWQFGGRPDEFGQALFRLFVFDHWLSLFGVNS
jgi:asparagine synthase (glutamine-hydrolysing)